MAKKVSGNELALILLARLLKTEELHYGLWPEGLEKKLSNLVKAQAFYTENLLGKIPDGVKTILDVGCGTGWLMQQLINRGYQVEGICPSPLLAQKGRERLGEKGEIHEKFFEKFQSDNKFDLVIFSESFQYIKPALSIPKAHGLLNPGGHILICDFFRTEATGYSALSGGHKLSKFQEVLSDQPFTIVSDEDLTEKAAPNMEVIENLLEEYISPVWEALAYYFSGNFPKLTWLCRKYFRKKLDKIKLKFFSGNYNAENFAKFKTYRCFLLQRND